MSQTRIEQLINEIYDFVDNCKASPLSQSKIIVPKDQLLDLIDELKRRTPDEIKRYQKIIANRESIVAQAEEQAKQIIEEANQKAAQLVEETVIMQQAYARANQLINDAREESDRLTYTSRETAESIRVGVLSYADDILDVVEKMFQSTYDDMVSKTAVVIDQLKANITTIKSNKAEIEEQLRDPESEITAEHAAETDADYADPELDVDPSDIEEN